MYSFILDELRLLRKQIRILSDKLDTRMVDEEDSTIQFSEQEYLDANPDVKRAVENGDFTSGSQHFAMFGRFENRRMSRAQH
jgi:hypothetical protein